MDTTRYVASAALLCLLWAGCTSPAPRATPVPPIRPDLPPNALVTQRAILTVRGRQFALTGYLATSETGGQRLIVTQSFGQVVADVLVDRNGGVHVLKSSPMFRPAWIERFVASDLQCVFGGTPPKDCSLRSLSSTHFLLKRRWYELDLQIVDVKLGPQPAELFDPAASSKP